MAKKDSFFTSTPFIVSATAIVGTGLFFGARALSKKLKERKSENASNQVDNKDPKVALAATLAQKAYTAFFPSGYPGLWDGTDEVALYNVAKQMFTNKIPFSYLTESYRKLYSRQFAQDLADELSAEELTKFYSNFQKGFGAAVTKAAISTIRQKHKARPNRKTLSLI